MRILQIMGKDLDGAVTVLLHAYRWYYAGWGLLGQLTHIEIATHAKGKVVPTGKIRTIQDLEGALYAR